MSNNQNILQFSILILILITFIIKQIHSICFNYSKLDFRFKYLDLDNEVSYSAFSIFALWLLYFFTLFYPLRPLLHNFLSYRILLCVLCERIIKLTVNNEIVDRQFKKLHFKLFSNFKLNDLA